MQLAQKHIWLTKEMQFVTVCTMINNIRIALTPLLIICFMCGLRIIEFPTNHSKPWFSFMYMLLLWSVYFLLFNYIMISYIIYDIMYSICFYLNFFIILVSIAFGIYHDKKFKNCLKKLTIVDDTLEKLGTTNDHKLHMRTVWLVLGWFATIILLTFLETIWLENEYNYNKAKAIYISLIINYCNHINLINNLIFIIILRYVGLKFDQVNQYLLDLAIDNERGIKRTLENHVSLSHKRKFLKIRNSKWMIWIIMQIHLELRKICHEIDSIFGMIITMSMGCYCCWLAECLREIFYTILINDYMDDRIQYLILNLSWFFIFFFKLVFMNFICESVSAKANATGVLINKISYSTCDVQIRENISQLLLQVVQAPVKFYGIGLFQFGYKFLYKFSKYIATVLIILAQDYANK